MDNPKHLQNRPEYLLKTLLHKKQKALPKHRHPPQMPFPTTTVNTAKVPVEAVLVCTSSTTFVDHLNDEKVVRQNLDLHGSATKKQHTVITLCFGTSRHTRPGHEIRLKSVHDTARSQSVAIMLSET